VIPERAAFGQVHRRLAFEPSQRALGSVRIALATVAELARIAGRAACAAVVRVSEGVAAASVAALVVFATLEPAVATVIVVVFWICFAAVDRISVAIGVALATTAQPREAALVCAAGLPAAAAVSSVAVEVDTVSPQSVLPGQA